MSAQQESITQPGQMGKVPFGTYHLGRIVFQEEPWWFFMFVILFFISAGAAVSLGVYGMYQWEKR